MILEFHIRDFVKLLSRYEFVEVECYGYAMSFGGPPVFKFINRQCINKMLGKSARSIRTSLCNYFRDYLVIHLYNMRNGLVLDDEMRIRDYEMINYRIIFEYNYGP